MPFTCRFLQGAHPRTPQQAQLFTWPGPPQGQQALGPTRLNPCSSHPCLQPRPASSLCRKCGRICDSLQGGVGCDSAQELGSHGTFASPAPPPAFLDPSSGREHVEGVPSPAIPLSALGPTAQGLPKEGCSSRPPSSGGQAPSLQVTIDPATRAC